MTAALPALVCLAAMRKYGRPNPYALVPRAVWLMGALTLLVLFCGLLLVLLALLVRNADDLDEPPAALSGEREARDGVWVTLAGGVFLAIAVGAWRFGMETRGLLVLIAAALVMAGWGGGRVLLAAGGAAHPARRMLIGGLAVLLVGAATFLFEAFLASLLP
ncbi:MAG: hypothetical protein NTW87_15515 [Planctomycetota bacterium]|nr:hypothetical protein [Planctomycetota bacterium]